MKNQESDPTTKRRKDYSQLPMTTETLSFRLPNGERERLRALFAKNGMTLTEGLKFAVYEFARHLEHR